MARPNFFIVGAPKCGTTSLYNWLKDHPQVFLSSTKEPHYFTETRPYRVVTTLADYLKLFDEASASHRAVGEASTTYLHSPGALEKVREFAPEAKIVVSVRNPIEMVPSMHSHNVFQMTEDVTDFEEAWNLSPERREGRRMPTARKQIDPIQADYQSMGLLGARVGHVLGLFPKEQVHIVVFDDVRTDPAAVYSRIQAFLDLEPHEREGYDSKNVTKRHSLITRIATGVPRPVLKILRRLGVANTGLVDRVVDRFGAEAQKPELGARMGGEMREFYREDVALLGRLLDRDLTHWLKPAP